MNDLIFQEHNAKLGPSQREACSEAIAQVAKAYSPDGGVAGV